MPTLNKRSLLLSAGALLFSSAKANAGNHKSESRALNGNVMYVGLFEEIGTLKIPIGTNIIHTSGFSTKGLDAALYSEVIDIGQAETAWLKKSANGRFWQQKVIEPGLISALTHFADISIDAYTC